MKKIGIMGTGSCFPERVVPNSYFEKIVDTTDEWIVSRTGIRTRRMIEPGQALSDLATHASEQALEMAGLPPEKLDIIVVGTSTADMLSPSAACIIQHRLGAKKAVAFDINAACPGFIYGLAVAQKFMQDGSYHHALVIGGEIISNRIDFKDRATCVLFGDGAGAVVLGHSNSNGDGEIMDVNIQSDGKLWELIHVPGGGSRIPASLKMLEEGLQYLKMQGNEVFKYAVRIMVDSAVKTMRSTGITSDEIDWFIPHQANLRIMETVARRLGIPLEKVIVTVHKHGNTSAASIPTALDEAVRSGKIQRGDLILTSSFGAGFTWGAALFRY
ncbi:MAG TPA: beta-ketoacyl-ACP synthase III [Thermodesulfobacteriota bacterium]|jgi:3-oxoacyl-[acyl-carrier-protein] synthase-3|nr:beta-ketoacyl-ACP synthase III [Thermodesulfobacteriota bacterium]